MGTYSIILWYFIPNDSTAATVKLSSRAGNISAKDESGETELNAIISLLCGTF